MYGPGTVLEDLVAEDLVVKDHAIEYSTVVENPDKEDNLWRLVVERQKFVRQAISSFFFCNIFCLFFSSSISDTIAVI